MALFPDPNNQDTRNNGRYDGLNPPDMEDKRMITAPRLTLTLLSLTLAPPLAAQSPVTACESQQSLEQALTSDGEIMPDDCRAISVARLSSDGQELCLLDLSSGDASLIGSLRDAAAPDQWWMLCADLTASARGQ